jgi:hypothetical protein
MNDPIRHGEFTNEPQLYALLRAVAEKRNMARRAIDDIAEFPIGYTEKLLAQVPQKRMSMDSLFPLAWALGIRFVAVDDPKNLARIADLLNGRRTERVSANVVSMRVKTASVLRKHAASIVKKDRTKWAKQARAAGLRKLTAKQRSAIARSAANTRHKRERAQRRIWLEERAKQIAADIAAKAVNALAASADPYSRNDNHNNPPPGRCCDTKSDANSIPSAAPRRPAASEHQQASKGERRAEQRAQRNE